MTVLQVPPNMNTMPLQNSRILFSMVQKHATESDRIAGERTIDLHKQVKPVLTQQTRYLTK